MLLPQLAFAQGSKNTFPNWMMADAKKRLLTYYAWLNAPWSDDDAPYSAIRQSIDQALATGQDAHAVYQRYKTQALQAPTDPKAVFGLTYAAYRAKTTPSSSSKTDVDDDLGNLYLLIANKKASLPHTYNYARLAFVSNAEGNADPKMKEIGLRLLQRDPNDHDVEYYVATVLNSSKDPIDRQRAVAYEEDLSRRTPHDPRLYRLLGMIHYNTAYLHHSQIEADQSIMAYQQYLGAAPPDRETEGQIRATIKFIQQVKERWKQEG